MSKHIDPEPDRRYIIRDSRGTIDSAIVINATDTFVRLHWEQTDKNVWYYWNDFQPDGDGRYNGGLQILEQIL